MFSNVDAKEDFFYLGIIIKENISISIFLFIFNYKNERAKQTEVTPIKLINMVLVETLDNTIDYLNEISNDFIFFN